MARAVDYTYTISYERVDTMHDDRLFKCTVAEFPDVSTFEDYPTQAYWMAVDAVESLIAMAEEMGHEHPAPRKRAQTGQKNV